MSIKASLQRSLHIASPQTPCLNVSIIQLIKLRRARPFSPLAFVAAGELALSSVTHHRNLPCKVNPSFSREEMHHTHLLRADSTTPCSLIVLHLLSLKHENGNAVLLCPKPLEPSRINSIKCRLPLVLGLFSITLCQSVPRRTHCQIAKSYFRDPHPQNEASSCLPLCHGLFGHCRSFGRCPCSSSVHICCRRWLVLGDARHMSENLLARATDLSRRLGVLPLYP